MKREMRFIIPLIAAVLAGLICIVSGCSQGQELNNRTSFSGLGFCLPSDWEMDEDPSDYGTESWATFSPHRGSEATEEPDGGIMVSFSSEMDGSVPWTMDDHYEDGSLIYDRIDKREIDGDECWTYKVSFVDDGGALPTYETFFWGDGFYYMITYIDVPFDPTAFVSKIERL